MKKILIIGGGGRLGRALVDRLKDKYEILVPNRKELDIVDGGSIRKMLVSHEPELVINAAAITDVDYCEANPAAAMAVNGEGPGKLAAACNEIGSWLIHFSTNYVFDGRKDSPYGESDPAGPINEYGKSKLEGERQVSGTAERWTIMRVAWLYGSEGNDFIKTILAEGRNWIATGMRGRQSPPIRVVADQIGNPTWVKEVARQVEIIIDKGLQGLFHCVSGGAISRFELAREIFRIKNIAAEITPCGSGEFGWLAKRPINAGLENKKLTELGLNSMKKCIEALMEYLEGDGRNL